jgi:hypothetical protein
LLADHAQHSHSLGISHCRTRYYKGQVRTGAAFFVGGPCPAFSLSWSFSLQDQVLKRTSSNRCCHLCWRTMPSILTLLVFLTAGPGIIKDKFEPVLPSLLADHAQHSHSLGLSHCRTRYIIKDKFEPVLPSICWQTMPSILTLLVFLSAGPGITV